MGRNHAPIWPLDSGGSDGDLRGSSGLALSADSELADRFRPGGWACGQYSLIWLDGNEVFPAGSRRVGLRVALCPLCLLRSLGAGDWKLAGALGACLGPSGNWSRS